MFRRGSRSSGRLRQASPADIAHLEQFVRSRRGVEGYVEPRTAVTETTLVLVALDGEWTRRRVPDAKYAHEFANEHGIPSYDAAVVGYPKRMREWTSRRAAEERRTRADRLDEA